MTLVTPPSLLSSTRILLVSDWLRNAKDRCIRRYLRLYLVFMLVAVGLADVIFARKPKLADP